MLLRRSSPTHAVRSTARLESLTRLTRLMENRFRNALTAFRSLGRFPVATMQSGPVLGPAPIRPAVAQALLKAEIEALPAWQLLVTSAQFSVYWAQAEQFSWCLQEIGRLRELTFRAAGEGTGGSSDVDLFDAYYLHLFVWDASAQAIVGAYRLGLADEIVARYGKRGLYTQSLFCFATRIGFCGQ